MEFGGGFFVAIFMKEQEDYYQSDFVQSRESLVGASVFRGKGVLWLPQQQQMSFAEQVSSRLAEKPNTMLQWTPEQLFLAMQEGRTALLTSSTDTGQLLGFAQVWEYQYDLFRYIHAPEGNFRPGTKRKVLEVGSWLSMAPRGSGMGFRVFGEAIHAGQHYDPEALQIAIIEQGNDRAQKVMEDLGGVKIGQKPSPVLQDLAGHPARMYIYDVTPHGIL